jgi:ABC-type multidrug transport system fused ATPase/permease subunit
VRDLSFVVNPGSLVAVVGESGAGKTTVLSLIQRFIDPSAGEILVDEDPLSKIPARDWRRSTAWVGQQPYMIAGTVADNLRIANEGASDDEMLRACSLAQLGAWVADQPMGLYSQLGEGGRRLSGGQAQRLALARAFLRDAPLVLMDEPTAHLDPPEEAVLERTVRDLCQGRTTILIAHRLSTIARADQILVMAGGKIVESGKHDELLAKNGTYAGLVAAAVGAR